MAERTVFSFRVDDADADRFEALRVAADRDRGDMARRVFAAGLTALAEQADDQRLALALQVSGQRTHQFEPQSNNALRCKECGGKRGDHR
jgi:hypothetical protein